MLRFPMLAAMARQRRIGTFGGASAAAAFLAQYGPYGMVMDFTDDASIAINDSADTLDYNSTGTISSTGALLGPRSKLTYSAPSPKLTEQADGYLAFQAHNLCANSENFSLWTVSSVSTPTLSSETLFGSAVYSIKPTTANAFHSVTCTSVVATTADVIHSVDIKADGYSKVAFRENAVSGVDVAAFDLSAGTVITSSGDSLPTITALGSGWYRCTFTVTGLNNHNLGIYILEDSYSGGTVLTAYVGDVTKGLLVTRAHSRRLPSVSTYVKTTSAAVYDLPYVYSAGVKTGILVEPAATNLCLYARDLTNAAWVKTSASAALTATGVDGVANSASTLTASSTNGVALQNITASSAAYSGAISLKRRTGTGAVTIAVGETTGSELVTNGTFATDVTGWTQDGGATITHSSGTMVITNSGASNSAAYQTIATTVGKIYRATCRNAGATTLGFRVGTSLGGTQNVSVLVNAGTTTNTCFVATATTSYVYVRTQSAVAAASVTADDISVLEVVESTIDLSSGNWVRASILNKTLTNPCVAVKLATSGDAVDVDIAQTESGTVATSPIITYGSSVVRAVDNISMATSLIPFSATEGTLYARAVLYAPVAAAVATALAVDDGTTSERVVIRLTDGTNSTFVVTDGGVAQVGISMGAPTTNTDYKLAGAYAANDFAASRNGGAAVTSGSGTLPTVTTVRFGTIASGQVLNGLLKVAAVFPVRKANATLVGMTT